jgi:phage FluMu protein gp41
MAPPSWDERFAEYKYNKKEGVQSSGGQRGWACKQRKMYAKGTLPDEHKEKLNSVGFEWNAAPNHHYDCEAWNEGFELLKAHLQKQGNCRGPFSQRKLDDWVRRQRKVLNDANGLNEVLQERWARLNALGFWEEVDPQKEPRRNVESDRDQTARASRASARTRERSDREMGQGPSGSRIDRITANEDTAPRSWDERFAEYKYKKENGLSLGNCGALTAWMFRQRRSNANGTLSDECKEKLNSVGFEWNAAPRTPYDCEAWNKSFKLLEAHRRKKGNCRGPFSQRKLDDWVRHQRKTLNDASGLNEVHQERRARLSTLGFWEKTIHKRNPHETSRAVGTRRLVLPVRAQEPENARIVKWVRVRAATASIEPLQMMPW